MKRLVLMLTVLLLSGCAAFKDYESVQSGLRAKVTFSKISNYVGGPETVDSPKMRIGVIEPDADCSFVFGQHKGAINLDREERTRTVFIPAGRAYLVISMDRLHSGKTSEYVSLLFEDGQEYGILYTTLKSDEPGKTRYAFSYYRIEGPDRKPVPVEVDHWSICEREKKAVKENSR